MKKKFFNLAVAMSVIASSLAFSSCRVGTKQRDNQRKTEIKNSNNSGSDEDIGEERDGISRVGLIEGALAEKTSDMNDSTRDQHNLEGREEDLDRKHNVEDRESGGVDEVAQHDAINKLHQSDRDSAQKGGNNVIFGKTVDDKIIAL